MIFQFPVTRPAIRLVRLVLLLALFLSAALADEGGKRNFDLPAGDATRTLKRFAEQAHREIMFPAEPLQGIETNAVKGEFTARQAIERMLAGTPLRATEDPKSGAFAVVRNPP